MSQQPQQGMAPMAPPTSGMAVASLISSILGITLIPTVGSVIGVILGYVARNQIRDSGGTIGGDGVAKAGIIVGWIGIALGVVLVCLFVVLPLAFGGGVTICALLENVY
jgi:predicted lysophospholipase L1 biosynthesis ABC-type transport system permease subunit